MQLAKDPCSEFRYSSPHDSCGLLGALPRRRDIRSRSYGRARWRGRSRTAAEKIGGVSILKPKELGGITAYNMSTGDKAWWTPNGGQLMPVTAKDPLFAGVKLPPAAPGNGQAQVITTKTLMIYGLAAAAGRRTPSRAVRGRQDDREAGRRGARFPRARRRADDYMHKGRQVTSSSRSAPAPTRRSLR